MWHVIPPSRTSPPPSTRTIPPPTRTSTPPPARTPPPPPSPPPPPPPPTVPPRRSTTDFLDGLRGLAAVTVFIQHYVSSFTLTQHEYGFGQEGHYHFASLPFLRLIWNGGNASVVLFFVLSGYVLSIGCLHKIRHRQLHATRRALCSAVLRRPLRLYLPPVLVCFTYALLLHVPGPLVLPLPWMKPQAAGLWAEICFFTKVTLHFFNPFRIHGSTGFWYPYNMVMWTIPIELKGSMLVFGLLALLSCIPVQSGQRRNIVAATALLCMTATVMLQMCWKWSMASFIFGLVLAILDVWKLDRDLLHRLTPLARSTLLHVMFFAGWYLLSQPAHAGQPDYSAKTPGWAWLSAMIPAGYDEHIYYRYWQSWGAVPFVYALLRIPWLQHFFALPSLKFLGKVSFMLYLVHLPILRIFGDRLHNLLGGGLADASMTDSFWNQTLSIPNMGPLGLSSRFVVCVALVLPSSLLVARLGTDYVDTPIVNLAKAMTAAVGLDARPPANTKTVSSVLPIARRRSF